MLPLIRSIIAILIIAPPALAQYPNIRISSPAENPEEVTITVNPTNPRNLIVGANISYYAYSSDGGWSWQEGHLTSVFGVWGDPCIIFDALGAAYFAHLSNPAAGYWLDRLVVQKSTNGGGTWNGGAPIATVAPHQHDKEWMIADHSGSPHRNNLYTSWTEFDQYASTHPLDSSRILFSRSTDFGASWSSPVRVSDQGGDCIDSDTTVQGAVPAVGPDGEIYTCWSSARGLMLDKSTDGGVSFGVDRYIGPQPGGWDFAIPGLQRCNGFPITLCDVNTPTRRGYLYIIFSDQRNGGENTDVFFIRSTDRGETWSEPLRVNSDSTISHQFLPWAALDPVNGDLWAVFYDRRAAAGNATDVYVARSTDAGESWSDFKVSDSSFTPTDRYFLGDYIGIAAYGGRAHPIWTRMDGSFTSVWTTIIGDSARVGVDEAVEEASGIVGLHGGSFGGMTTITYAIPQRAHVSIDIHDALGRPLRRLVDAEREEGKHSAWWDGRGDDGRPVVNGIYFIVMKREAKAFVRKMLLVR